MMIRNQLKARLKQGEKTAGSWAQMASPLTAEILALAGFDWVLIDLEHSPADMMNLVTMIQAVESADSISIVRAPWNDFVTIKRILDCGAYGVIIPYVNTAQEAQSAVRACKYPPHGIRGIAGSPRAMGFGKYTQEYIHHADDEILVIPQIETAEAVKNIKELVRVEGVDGFFIGPMDLATSMGFRGNPKHPEVGKAYAVIEEAVLGSGKILGTLAASWEQAEDFYERGYQLVTLLSDGTTIMKAAASAMEKFCSYRDSSRK